MNLKISFLALSFLILYPPSFIAQANDEAKSADLHNYFSFINLAVSSKGRDAQYYDQWKIYLHSENIEVSFCSDTYCNNNCNLCANCLVSTIPLDQMSTYPVDLATPYSESLTSRILSKPFKPPRA